jgi:hypothetical protein
MYFEIQNKFMAPIFTWCIGYALDTNIDLLYIIIKYLHYDFSQINFSITCFANQMNKKIN